MKKDAILIDICGTLFYSNTTFDLLDKNVDTPQYNILRRLMLIKICRYANNIIYRLFNKDLFRELALKNLKGYTDKELSTMAETFYSNYLEQRKNKEVWQYLETIKDKNQLVLVSGTIEPIAKTISDKTGIKEYLSTTLKYENGICKGKIAKDVLRIKDKILIKREILPPYQCIITDNPGDLPLIKLSRTAKIITYHNRERWEKLTKGIKNIQYIESDDNYKFRR